MMFAGGKSAFAAAIEQFQKAKTIVCRVSSPHADFRGAMTFETTGKLYFSAEYGSRYEMWFNGATVDDFSMRRSRGP